MDEIIIVTVEAVIDTEEVRKLNEKRKKAGVAQTTATNHIENLISDALHHNWIVDSFKVVVTQKTGEENGKSSGPPEVVQGTGDAGV